MWVGSKLGWFSVVEKKPGIYHIRARERQDIENIKEAADLFDEIREEPGSDYMYRVVTNKRGFSDVMKVLEESVDYPNFKNEIKRTPDQKNKVDAYNEVWWEMYCVQERLDRNPTTNRKRNYLDDKYSPENLYINSPYEASNFDEYIDMGRYLGSWEEYARED